MEGKTIIIKSSSASKIKDWLITGCLDKKYISGIIDFSARKLILRENPTFLKKAIFENYNKNKRKPLNFTLIWLSQGTEENKKTFKELFKKIIVTYDDLCFFYKELIKFRGCGSVIKKAVSEWFRNKLTDVLMLEMAKSNTDIELKKLLRVFHIKPNGFEQMVAFKRAVTKIECEPCDTTYKTSSEKFIKKFDKHKNESKKTIEQEIESCTDLFLLLKAFNKGYDDKISDVIERKLENHNKPIKKICFVIDKSAGTSIKSDLVLSALVSEKDYVYEYKNGNFFEIKEIPLIKELINSKKEYQWYYPKSYKIVQIISPMTEVVCFICGNNRWPKMDKKDPNIIGKRIIYIYPQVVDFDISNYDKEDYVFKGYKQAMEIIPELF